MKRAGQKAAELKKVVEDAKVVPPKVLIPQKATGGSKVSNSKPQKISAEDLKKLIPSTAENMHIKAKADALDKYFANEKILEGLKYHTLSKITSDAHKYAEAHGTTSDKLHEIDDYRKAIMPEYGRNKNASETLKALKGWESIATPKLDLNKDLDKILDTINKGGVKIDEETLKKSDIYDKVIFDEKILESLSPYDLDRITKAAHKYAKKNGSTSDKFHEINDYYKAVTTNMETIAKDAGLSEYSPGLHALSAIAAGPLAGPLVLIAGNEGSFQSITAHSEIIQPLVDAHWADIDIV